MKTMERNLKIANQLSRYIPTTLMSNAINIFTKVKPTGSIDIFKLTGKQVGEVIDLSGMPLRDHLTDMFFRVPKYRRIVRNYF